MKLGLIINLLFYFVAILMQNQGCSSCLENERIGLLEIKHYFVSQKGADLDIELDSWVDDRDSNCCTWDRVQCSNTYSGHITELYLYNLLSYGSYHMMNVSLFRPFEELSLLDLSANNIGGWTDNEGISLISIYSYKFKKVG
jgi:hypothetical protein